MRAAVDLLGVLLLGLSGAALLVVTVLAVVGFSGNDTGVGLLFSSLALICLPLVAFAGWRAFRPLWLLSQELNNLRTREQQLLAQITPRVSRAGAARPGGGTRPGKVAKAAQTAAIEQRLPAGRSVTGWKSPPPQRGVATVLSTRQVGWRVVVAIGVITLLFTAGLLVGVLVRG
jgi:hypothetical protein